jgi:hypothetical protein
MATYIEMRTPSFIIRFYKDQLKKFKALGIGNYTEHNVEVTESLIKITEYRLAMLTLKKQGLN